jgi:hypothetical protein
MNDILSLTEIERRLQTPKYQRTHIAEELKTHLEQHKTDLQTRQQRILECERKIETLIHGPYTNLYDLCLAVKNVHQKEALSKLDSALYGTEIYLSSYEKNTSQDKKKQGTEGTFTILGTLKKGGVREEYEVKMYKPNADPKGTFWCSCPDHKFNSAKKDMVCKHICFLVCRVGKFMDVNFFNTKKLSPEQFESLQSKMENIQTVLKDPSISRPKTSITADLFHSCTKPLDPNDICPICYDDMFDAAKQDVLSCPTCLNYVHKSCMSVWLERKDSCVYCRCDCWKLYRQSS